MLRISKVKNEDIGSSLQSVDDLEICVVGCESLAYYTRPGRRGAARRGDQYTEADESDNQGFTLISSHRLYTTSLRFTVIRFSYWHVHHGGTQSCGTVTRLYYEYMVTGRFIYEQLS